LILPAGFLSRIESTQISGTPGNSDEESSRIHLELVRTGILMMEANPIVGVGLGKFSQEVEKYNPHLINMTGRPFIAHDTYCQIGAESGIPVLVIWLSLMACGLANLRRVARFAGGESVGELAIAMRYALLAYSVTALFLTAEWVVPYWLMIFLSQNLREIATTNREPELVGEVNVAGAPYLPVAV